MTAKPATTKEVISELWPFLRPHKIALSVFCFCNLLQVAFLISLPISYRYIFDIAVRNKNIKLLIFITIGLLIGFIIRTISDYIALKLITRVGADMTTTMRTQLFTHIQSLSPDFYQRIPNSNLFSAFTDNIFTIESAVVSASGTTLRAAILIYLSFIALFWESWLLGTIVLVLFFLSFLLPKLLSARRDSAIEVFDDCEKDFLFTLREFITTHIIIRLYSLLNYWFAATITKIETAARANRHANFYTIWAPRSFVASSYMIEVVVIIVGALAVIQGKLTIGIIFGMLPLMSYILGGAETLGQQLPAFVRAANSMRSLMRILKEKPAIAYSPNAIKLPPFSRNIAFKHVDLVIANGKVILKDINFIIAAGQSVALVGPSGSGKSSILKLLMRLYDPSQGSIIFDGKYDLRDVDEVSLHEQMSVVLQESLLFDMTVRDNILMGRLDANEEDIIKAAQQAGLHEDIMLLPEGYNTIIGESGGELSRGQQQRLTLARGLVRHPRLLLLDEVTSSVDAISEADINKSLQECSHQCTLIMATHRLNLAAHFHKIYVLEHGRIVERGTHQELLQKKQLYAKLWQKQNSVTLTPEQQIASIDLQYLSTLPILQYCSKEFLEKLTKQFIVENYDAKQLVIKEGTLGEKFYLIARGEVEVLKRNVATNQNERVATLSEGDYFGEIALLTNEKRIATVQTITPCVLLTLTRHQFAKLLTNFPALKANLEGIAAKRKM